MKEVQFLVVLVRDALAHDISFTKTWREDGTVMSKLVANKSV
jgi:hypothetical protein